MGCSLGDREESDMTEPLTLSLYDLPTCYIIVTMYYMCYIVISRKTVSLRRIEFSFSCIPTSSSVLAHGSLRTSVYSDCDLCLHVNLAGVDSAGEPSGSVITEGMGLT